MIYDRFEHLLKQTIGLDAASIGSSAVARAVQSRAQACGAANAELYWSHIASSQDELQALIEAVVVPETWFFRDRRAFDAMVQIIKKEWLPKRTAGSALRLLSLPCSTGEEPYTMAMALLDSGFAAEVFEIDAIDISSAALDRARRAVYGRNSFRGDDLGFRERHFVETELGFQVSPAVRSRVRFRQANLFDAASSGQVYDIVFCRNVLIYFDAHDQHRAVEVLRRLLAADGFLFVGHAEASLMLERGFASVGIPHAFAFREAHAPSPHAKPSGVSPAFKTIRAVRPPAAAVPPPPRRQVPSPDPKPKAVQEAATGLERIRQAADRGDLDGAFRRAEAELRADPENAEALHLMGTINDAAGNFDAAVAYYRKALYLDPGHEEALAHLALLLEKRGDVAGAQLTRDRARRSRARKGA